MAHKTMIDGTAYSIASGKTTVDGTTYSILRGGVLIDGTKYSINFTPPELVLYDVDVSSAPGEGISIHEFSWANSSVGGSTPAKFPNDITNKISYENGLPIKNFYTYVNTGVVAGVGVNKYYIFFNGVDFTPYTKVKAVFSSAGCKIGISSINPENSTLIYSGGTYDLDMKIDRKTTDDSSNNLSLDISDISGNNYIICQGNRTTTTDIIFAYLKKLWLSKD